MELNLLKETEKEDESKKKAATDGRSPVLFTDPAEPSHPLARRRQEKQEQTEYPSLRKKNPATPEPVPGSSVRQASRKEKKGKKQETVPREDVEKGVGVNLLMGEYAVDNTPPSLRRFFWTLFLMAGTLLILLGVVLSILRVLQSTAGEEGRQLRERIAEVTAARTELAQGEEEVRSLLKEVDVVEALLHQHVRWTKFFTFVERVTLRDVYYTNLSVHPEGGIRLAAVGRDFTAVARQLLSFEEADEVDRVRMTNASAERREGDPVVVFDLELFMKPDLLFSKELLQ